MARVLEEMDGVVCYAKNETLRFSTPTPSTARKRTINSALLVWVQHGEEPINLIIEVAGEKNKEKAAKVATARTL